MSAVQLWFLFNTVLCLAGAYAAHEGADHASYTGESLRAGVWTVLMYGYVAAGVGNAAFLFVKDDEDDDAEK